MKAHRALPAMWLAVVALLTAAAPSLGAAESEPQGVGLSRGVDRLIAEIRERELTLKRRERELDRRNRSLAELKGLVDQRLEELAALRSTIEERIERWSGQDDARAKRLAKVYSAMPPTEVAGLIERLGPELGVLVVRQMKDKKSAAVLAALPRARALDISRRMLQPLSTQRAGSRSNRKK